MSHIPTLAYTIRPYAEVRVREYTQGAGSKFEGSHSVLAIEV
jgi:hypothetical protein